jgi:hypothetical protein
MCFGQLPAGANVDDAAHDVPLAAHSAPAGPRAKSVRRKRPSAASPAMNVRRRNVTWLVVAAVAVARLGYATSGRGGDQTESDSWMSDGRDTVVRVVDGDTVVLRSAGKSRLIGVDTPEVFGRPRLLRPGGLGVREAHAAARHVGERRARRRAARSIWT